LTQTTIFMTLIVTDGFAGYPTQIWLSLPEISLLGRLFGPCESC